MSECRCDECRSFWHDAARPFRCEVCKRRFLTNEDYFQHLRRHPVGRLARAVDRKLFGEPPRSPDLPPGYHVVEE